MMFPASGLQVHQFFETVFIRGVGLKLTWREVGFSGPTLVRPRRVFAMWGNRLCLYSYAGEPDAFFRDCQSPPRYRVVGDYGFVQHAVPSYFLTDLAGGLQIRAAEAEVSEYAGSDGVKVLKVSARSTWGSRTLWIDPTSRHIVRYIESRMIPTRSGDFPETAHVEYHNVELDPRLSTSAVWVWLPWSLLHAVVLEWLLAHGAALFVPVVVLFFLAYRYGRERLATPRGVALRAILWSAAVCWSVLYYRATGADAQLLLAPAWLLMVWRIVSGPAEVAVVPALWLSPVLPVVAYLTGAWAGRRSAAAVAGGPSVTHDHVIRA